ncbi:MAG: Rab family GTPase [Candidatus Odinarchaeota archaeon]
MTQQPAIHMLKIVLTGDGGVGKTSLITQYIHGKIRPGYKATIGVDIFKKEVITSRGIKVILQIWDLSGQSRFGQIRNRFYNGADGQIVVFDITNESTLHNISGWVEEASMNLKNLLVALPKVIVGNKIDLPEDQQINHMIVDSEIQPTGYPYYLTSAVTGENVELIFTEIAEQILAAKKAKNQ